MNQGNLHTQRNSEPKSYSATTWDNNLPVYHDNLLHVAHDNQNIFPTRWNDIQCSFSHSQWNGLHSNYGAKIEDCKAAINIIPRGTVSFDPDPRYAGSRHRPNIYLSERRRKLFLPAAFRSGTCSVSVLNIAGAFNSDHGAPPPTVGADFLYFTVWPNARRLALYILEKCPGGMGSVHFDSCPENKSWFGTFRFEVQIFQRLTEVAFLGGILDDLLNVYE